MFEDFLINYMKIDDINKKDLKDIFKLCKKLDNKILLAINIYSMYILENRSVIK